MKLKKLKPSKELQRAIDKFPALIKHKAKVAREKKRIRKNFESAREEIFGKEKTRA